MLRTPSPSASRNTGVVFRPMRSILVALIAAAGLVLLPGTTARAAADNGTGPGGDGTLQLIPEVITNSGISAGGSNDFPVKAQLFLPAMTERARQLQKSEETITGAVGRMSLSPHANPLFARAYSETRDGLFADYAPQTLPTAGAESDAQGTDLWLLLMMAAAFPLTLLAVWLGWKNASRRNRHGRATP